MASPPSLLLEELTWPEIRDLVAAGWTRVLITSGSIEQHGPHLPLVVDTALGYEVSLRVAQRLGHCLVAPVIRPGCSEHHMPFAGSLTIPPELLKGMLDAYVGSLSRHGFTTMILLSSHGGNFSTVAEAEAELNARYGGQGVRCVAVCDLDAFIKAQNCFLEERGVDVGAAGSHAGLAETSEMLVVRPDLVRTDRYEPGYVGPIDTDRLWREGMTAYTKNGILGDPTPGSSAAVGELSLEGIADYIAGEVRARLGE